jgi:hypothetical protein
MSAVARPRLARGRLVAPVVALALAGVVAIPGLAAAAPTDSIVELQTALSTCTDPTSITLTRDLIEPDASLEVACDATIDLAGHDLTVQNVVVGTGETLTVTDSTPLVSGSSSNADSGTLVADAGDYPYHPGIRTANATLVTSGTAILVAVGGSYAAGIGGGSGGSGGITISGDRSTITATGGTFAAGIGGGYGGSGGTTTSNDDSSITATGGAGAAGIGGGFNGAGGIIVSNDYSTITATGGPDDQYGNGAGAGIGGGPLGTGAGTTTVNSGSTVTATARSGASAVGLGAYGVAGSGTFLAILGGTLRLPGGSTLDVPDTGSDPEVTIGAGGLIEGSLSANPTYGAITGAGQVVNGGAIRLPAANITATSIAEHHYLVSFDTQGGSAEPDDVRVHADTFTVGNRTFPADPTTTGYVFTGWNTQPDGSGDTIDADTSLPGSSSDGTAHAVPLFAQYGLATDSVSNLRTALSACTGPTTIVLTHDLTDTGAALGVACDNTIDLAGHDLAVRNVVVDTSKTFTVTDSTPVADGADPNADAGTFTVNASTTSYTAGIKTTGAALVTSGTAGGDERGCRHRRRQQRPWRGQDRWHHHQQRHLHHRRHRRQQCCRHRRRLPRRWRHHCQQRLLDHHRHRRQQCCRHRRRLPRRWWHHHE